MEQIRAHFSEVIQKKNIQHIDFQELATLHAQFPASQIVTFLYAYALKESNFSEYERAKSRLLLSVIDREQFCTFKNQEVRAASASDVIVSAPAEPQDAPQPPIPTESASDAEPLPTPQSTTHVDNEVIDGLIEKFSNDPPKIKFDPAVHDDSINYGKSSCVEDPEIISETLARIFADQGYTGKAIKIYKKLSLHNPEKSVYFADQIKKLKLEKK